MECSELGRTIAPEKLYHVHNSKHEADYAILHHYTPWIQHPSDELNTVIINPLLLVTRRELVHKL